MGSKYDRFMTVLYCLYIMSIVIIRRMEAGFPSSCHSISLIVAVVTVSKSSFAMSGEAVSDQNHATQGHAFRSLIFIAVAHLMCHRSLDVLCSAQASHVLTRHKVRSY